jgi:CheY-like chemotaxis protein
VQETLLKAKEKAEAGDKLKSAFLNNISHELRTPLNGIIGFSEMLTQMESTQEDRIEFSKMIKRSSSRLINTINSYMDISMIVSGITEINIRTFSLNRFLDKINDQTLEICNLRNLSLHLINKTPSSEVLITTDEHLLNKIFSQLIDNAIKFTKEGSVTIGYEQKAGLHTFSVSDTGSGIPEDALSVIFEVFMQADLSTSRGYEGSGLGLSIAQGFVQLLGGEIWVEANSNKGSTFCFTLPDIRPTQGENVSTTTQTQDSSPAEPLILVAEDEDSNYKYLEIVLRKASFKVLRAINGFETIDLCRLHPDIKILLIDMKMPGMDGFEATRQIRRILPDLPIVALSAFVSAQDENMAMEAGCNEYVVKPVSRLKLLETINRLLASHGK